MTWQNILSNIRTILDEATATRWTNAEVQLETNNGYQEVVTAVMETFEDYYLTQATTSLVADQQEYQLPSDFFKVRRVEVNYDASNSDSIPQRALPVNMDEVRRDLGNQTIGVSFIRKPGYYLSHDNIGIIHVPPEASTNGLKIWYIRYVTNESSFGATKPDIPYPDRYAKLIVLYGAGQLLRKGQIEETSAARYLAEFEIGLEKMKRQLEDRTAEESKQVIDISGESVAFDDYLF